MGASGPSLCLLHPSRLKTVKALGLTIPPKTNFALKSELMGLVEAKMRRVGTGEPTSWERFLWQYRNEPAGTS